MSQAIDTSKYRVGQSVSGRASLRTSKTRPPRQFAEGDLVDIMDDIGRYAQIGRDEMAILRQKNHLGSGKAGIGTARTRGEIIKKTFESGYLEKYKEKEGKRVFVRPTPKALGMYDRLVPMPAACVLVSPELTAKWEAGLEKIESGAITSEQFMEKIRPMVTDMVREIRASQTVSRGGPSGANIEPHPMDGQVCGKCSKGCLKTLKSTNPQSRACGKRFTKCDSCGAVDNFID